MSDFAAVYVERLQSSSTGISLQILVFFGEGHILGLLLLFPVLRHQGLVYINFGGCKGGRSNEVEFVLAHKLPREPKERLLEVVVRFGRDLEVLQVLLPVESDRCRLDFPFLHVDLVPAQHDRDVLAHTLEIAMPVGYVLIRDAGGDVEHDNAALALNVVSIPETTELLLTRGIPHVEADCAEVRFKRERVDLNTQCGDVFLFELARQMALDKCRLPGATVTNKDELERRDSLSFGHDRL